MPTSPSAITALPTAPNRNMANPAFVAAADAFVAAWETFRTEMNASADVTYDNAVEAAASALAALGYKNDATAAAAAAVSASTYMGTSTSSITMAAGTKTAHTAQTGRAFAVDDPVVLIVRTDPDARLYGAVSVSDGSDDYSVVVAADGVVGSGGPYADWIMIHQAFLPVGATAAELRALTSPYVTVTPDSIADALDEVTLTDGATITPDFGAGWNFTVTLAGNRALANPSNLGKRQSGYIRVVQDGTGSRTLSFGSAWKREGGAPTLTTTASATDYIFYQVISASVIVYSIVKAPS